MQGFVLGLSSGAACIAYCAPVLIPYLLGEKKNVLQNALVISQFLGGRLLGYLVFGVIAWGINRSILQAVDYPEFIVGIAYVVLSGFLILYSFLKTAPSCAAERMSGLLNRVKSEWQALLPGVMGVVTGLSFCPPFLLALTNAAEKGSLFHSLFFFFTFFLGTSIFFLPAPLLGICRGIPVLQTIGKLAAGIMGLYYLYSGIILLIGGMKRI
jgi:sulfite exporter TauE/SafE